jgi:hypothetical protein
MSVTNELSQKIDECFALWDEIDEDEPRSYGVANQLLKVAKNNRPAIIKLLQEFKLEPYAISTRVGVWEICFGQRRYDYHALSNRELVYYLLECCNYNLIMQDGPCIWDILPAIKKLFN